MYRFERNGSDLYKVFRFNKEHHCYNFVGYLKTKYKIHRCLVREYEKSLTMYHEQQSN